MELLFHEGVEVFQGMELLWTVWLGPFHFVCFLSALDYCRLIMDIYTITSINIYVSVTDSKYT